MLHSRWMQLHVEIKQAVKRRKKKNKKNTRAFIGGSVCCIRYHWDNEMGSRNAGLSNRYISLKTYQTVQTQLFIILWGSLYSGKLWWHHQTKTLISDNFNYINSCYCLLRTCTFEYFKKSVILLVLKYSLSQALYFATFQVASATE